MKMKQKMNDNDIIYDYKRVCDGQVFKEEVVIRVGEGFLIELIINELNSQYSEDGWELIKYSRRKKKKYLFYTLIYKIDINKIMKEV